MIFHGYVKIVFVLVVVGGVVDLCMSIAHMAYRLVEQMNVLSWHSTMHDAVYCSNRWLVCVIEQIFGIANVH